MQLTCKIKKKKNKKHTLHNKESLSELGARAFCANSFPGTVGRRGQRGCGERHAGICVAPSEINCSEQPFYKAVLGSGGLGLFRAYANTGAGYGSAFRMAERREALWLLPRSSPVPPVRAVPRSAPARRAAGEGSPQPYQNFSPFSA